MALGVLTLANYNGFIAPLDPDMDYYRDEYSASWNGRHYIFKIYGNYYMAIDGLANGIAVCVDKSVSPHMLFFNYLSAQYVLNKNGRWVTTNIFSTGKHIVPIDDVEVIYADNQIYGINGIDWYPYSTYIPATKPTAYAVTDYPELPTVVAYGWNKGGSISEDVPTTADCHLPQFTSEDFQDWVNKVRNVCYATVPNGGTLAVDWYKDGELYSTSTVPGATGIYSRFQPPLEETGSQTWHAVVTNDDGTYIRAKTLDSFTFTVVGWNFETNTQEAEEGDEEYDETITIPDDVYEENTDETTPEELRAQFWKGFSAGVALYGGTTQTSNAAATSEDSESSESALTELYWRGFASAVAMYGLGRSNGTTSEDGGSTGDDNTDTTSVLGTAILGTMLLGE